MSAQTMLCRFMSSRHGTFSDCGWRRPPEWTVAANVLNKQSVKTD